jgi:hypothetical protein
MAMFDQPQQVVTTQYNAAGDIGVSADRVYGFGRFKALGQIW